MTQCQWSGMLLSLLSGSFQNIYRLDTNSKTFFSLSFSVKCLTSSCFVFCCLDIVILKILFSTKLCQMLLKILKVAECSQHKQEKDFFHSLCYGSLFPTTSKISPSKFDSVVLFHVAAQYQQICRAVAATAVSVFRKSYSGS